VVTRLGRSRAPSAANDNKASLPQRLRRLAGPVAVAAGLVLFVLWLAGLVA
jgi:hypothetical protein